MVDAFAEPFALATGLVTSTVTVGVATTVDSIDTDELLRHADLALYAAKAAGKRQWRRYQPVLSTGLLRRRELQEALEEAVSTRAFTLVYQPIVALDTGELAGFEALVRWPHPEWGMMQPGPVHHPGRGDRPDHRDRRLGARAGPPPTSPGGSGTRTGRTCPPPGSPESPTSRGLRGRPDSLAGADRATSTSA